MRGHWRRDLLNFNRCLEKDLIFFWSGKVSTRPSSKGHQSRALFFQDFGSQTHFPSWQYSLNHTGCLSCHWFPWLPFLNRKGYIVSPQIQSEWSRVNPDSTYIQYFVSFPFPISSIQCILVGYPTCLYCSLRHEGWGYSWWVFTSHILAIFTLKLLRLPWLIWESFSCCHEIDDSTWIRWQRFVWYRRYLIHTP